MHAVSEFRCDAAALIDAYRAVRGRAAVKTAARGRDTLSSISLTHRPGAADPLHDGSNSQFGPLGDKVYEENEFSVFNEAFCDTYFFEIYNALPFQAGRVRLMMLPPLKIYKMHRDATKRAHIAIVTNPDCRLVFRSGQTAHVPADGRLYVADTREFHTAYNAGDSERVHLAISMAETESPAARR